MYILDKLSSLIWGPPLIVLLLFTGLLFTFRLKGLQLRLPYFLLHRNDSANKGLSQFRTVCMSLGAAMGTGNITGVSAAIVIGGAGSLFWMWISAFIGMATVYAENYLSVLYSSRNKRGPMAYLEKAVGGRRLACIFAVMCVLAAFGMGGMIQVSAFAESLRKCVRIPDTVMFFIMCILIYSVVSGGASRIGTAAQALLPAASAVYAVLCAAVIIKHHGEFSAMIASVFTQAFGIRPAAGGISGYALSKAVSAGIRRGTFSNEAGLGSSPVLHSAAESDSPHTQGMWSMFEVFFDTMICCTLTAFTLLSSGQSTVQDAFSFVAGPSSVYIVSVLMAVFAFCTVIGWYYCGETAFLYLSGGTRSHILPIVFAVTASAGTLVSVDLVWILADIFNGTMAFPNLVGLLLLRDKVKRN